MSATEPVLLMADGIPILMRIPSGTAYIGFASEGLGRRYLGAVGITTQSFSFSSVQSVVSVWPEEKLKSLPAIYFRTVDDVALFLKDKSTFPYSDFESPVDELDPRG